MRNLKYILRENGVLQVRKFFQVFPVERYNMDTRAYLTKVILTCLTGYLRMSIVYYFRKQKDNFTIPENCQMSSIL